MKNDNKLVKFTIFVLLITIIAICLVSSTYAKYTTTVTGSDVATVAKWSIIVNGNKEIATTGSETITFDLFKTIKDSDGTANETDIATVDGKNLIAPGTSGSFDLKVKNASEVTAKYTISFNVTNSNSIPLKFSTDGGNTWSSTLTATTEKTLAVNSAEDIVNVQWKWDFAGNDTTDTSLGITAQGTAPVVTVESTITATQVD